MMRICFGLLAALTLANTVAEAQQPPAPNKIQIAEACGADIDRLCPGVPPGQGRIKACMKAHVSQLSASCFDTLMAAAAAKKEQ
jgi:cysteine rich repeat protein